MGLAASTTARISSGSKQARAPPSPSTSSREHPRAPTRTPSPHHHISQASTASLTLSRRSQQRAFPAPPPPASHRSKHPQPSLWLPSTPCWPKSPRHLLATHPRALAMRSRRRRPQVCPCLPRAPVGASHARRRQRSYSSHCPQAPPSSAAHNRARIDRQARSRAPLLALSKLLPSWR